MPVEQLAQYVEPPELAKVLATQEVHGCPASEKDPLGHSIQKLEPVLE